MPPERYRYFDDLRYQITEYGKISGVDKNDLGHFVVAVDLFPWCSSCRREGYGCEHITNHNEHSYVLIERQVIYANGLTEPHVGDYFLFMPDRPADKKETKNLPPMMEIRKSLDFKPLE